MSLLERIYEVAEEKYGKDGRLHLDIERVQNHIKNLELKDSMELSSAVIEELFFKLIPMADYANIYDMSYSSVQKNKNKYLSVTVCNGGYYIGEFELPHTKINEFMGNNILKEIQNRDGVYEYLREVSSMEKKSLSEVIADILENNYKQIDEEEYVDVEGYGDGSDYNAKLAHAKLKK